MKPLKRLILCVVILYSFVLYAQDEDPSADYWTNRADMPTARRYLGSATVDGKIYVIGGYGGPGGTYLATNECYDPVTDTWETKASMPTARNGLAVVALGGKIYAIGGYDGSDEVAVNEVYDPVSNNWTTKASMPTARRYVGGAALGGLVYVVGGQTDGSYKRTTEAYDPSTDTWSSRADLSVGKKAVGVVALGGKLYAVGGYKFDGPCATLEEYDPISDSWTVKASMATARSALGVAGFSGRLHAIGGAISGSAFTDVVEEYSINSDSWTTKTPLPAARGYLTAAVAKNRIYAIGGRKSGVGYVADNDEYTPSRFTDTAGALKIVVTAYMTGIAFSLDATAWSIGEMMPARDYISPCFNLQNDGGVNIDIAFQMEADTVSPGGWTPISNITYADWSTYPGTDEYFLTPELGDAGYTAPTAKTDFGPVGLEVGVYKEATSTQFAADVTSADGNGINLVAYAPGDDDADEVNIYLLFIAPASTTQPGTSEAPHYLTIDITARLSAVGW